MNCESNLCLDARADGTVQVSSCSANNPELRNQQWDANTPSAQNIQNRGIGQCLDINADDNTVRTNGCEGWKDAQKWNFVQDWNPNPISNQYTNQCLQGGKDLSLVEAAKCNGSLAQRWKWVSVGDTAPGCPPH